MIEYIPELASGHNEPENRRRMKSVFLCGYGCRAYRNVFDKWREDLKDINRNKDGLKRFLK